MEPGDHPPAALAQLGLLVSYYLSLRGSKSPSSAERTAEMQVTEQMRLLGVVRFLHVSTGTLFERRGEGGTQSIRTSSVELLI